MCARAWVCIFRVARRQGLREADLSTSMHLVFWYTTLGQYLVRMLSKDILS